MGMRGSIVCEALRIKLFQIVQHLCDKYVCVLTTELELGGDKPSLASRLKKASLDLSKVQKYISRHL